MRNDERGMMNAGILASAVLAGLLAVSCGLGKSDPGSFEIVFDWLDPAPEDNAGLWVWARVDRREAGAAQGVQMAEAALTAFSPGVQLPFSDVPYSENLVVVVEIKEGQSKTARAKYFGESDVFALEPGKHVKVTARLKLTKTPDAPDGALTIVEATEKGYVKTNTVTLSLDPKGATAVTAANDMGFSAGTVAKKLGELQQKNGRYLWSGWDLNAGLCTAQASGVGLQASGSVSTACRDGLRTVFAKFVNDAGYESEVFSAQVTLDTTPPTVESSVSPPRAGGGMNVVVVVNSSEPLAEVPFLHVLEVDPGFTDMVQLGNSFSYKSEYPVDENTPDGAAYSFTVDLEDLAGNKAEGIPLDGTVTVDRTPPAVSGGTIDKTRMGVGAAVTVAFSVDEELLEKPVVTIGDKTMSPAVGDRWSVVRPTVYSLQSPAYAFSYTTSGTEPEGAFLVNIQTVDLAGNRHSETLPDRVTFDFSPPQVVSSVASPSLAALGGEIVFQVTIDEPLAPGSAPKLVTTPVALAWTDAEAEGSSYRWKHTAQAGESGTYTVAIDQLCDDLGNCAGNVTEKVAAVQIDADAPRLNGAAELLPAPDARVKTGVEVRLNVNVEENMGLATGFPRARIGGKEMPPARAPDRGWAYTFAYLTDETKDAEGPQAVVVELVDAAGNTKMEIAGSVTYDFTAPNLMLKVQPEGRPVRLWETVTVTVTADEELDAAGVTLDKGGLNLGAPSVSGTSYTWLYEVKTGETGNYTFSATANDKAGNPTASAKTGSVTLDGAAPMVKAHTVGPSRVKSAQDVRRLRIIKLTVALLESYSPGDGYHAA
ncbi:MAG: hypothetical protein HY897_20790 [Deltaproteobacteria bacterium]|nr:hypothetical protein [Deltaproteobacteria bacterium]